MLIMIKGTKISKQAKVLEADAVDLPIVSDKNTLTNVYNYQYTELYENNISNISLFLKSANSLTNDDVKLSGRYFYLVN